VANAGPTFKAVRRGGKVILLCQAPISAFFSGPGLMRDPFKEAPGEICFRFSYAKQMHQQRELTGHEVPERWEMDLTRWAKGLRRIRIKIDGQDDVVIDSVRLAE
jgi:hypothetical protein